MINFIINWSLDNRLPVLLSGILLAILGGLALIRTPIDAIPDLSDVQVIIKTSYPGQAPSVVEDQVTYPLSSAMLSVAGAENVRGYSFFGDSFIYVIFEDGTDLYWARSRVLEVLSQVRSSLPESAVTQLGPDATGVGWVYEYALVDRSGKHDLGQLRSLQDWFLKIELQTVPGVAEVATVGGMVSQYQVVLDPDSLRAFNIPFADVRKAIEQGNREVGGSVVEIAEAEYMVRATGYISSTEDLNLIPVGLNANGTPIRLEDVADVRRGPQMRRGIADLNGEGEVTGGIVVMRHGENALQTISSIKNKLEELQSSLPDGVELVETYDRSALIERSVNTLRSRLIEELVVVILVCAIFLAHLRSSIVILVTLPLGVLTAFSVMHLQGLNANIMSLGGIAIAIGAMVDASIVMIENLHKKMEQQDYRPARHWEYVKMAVSEVGGPLFTSLLIITLSFIPVFTLQAQEGRMFAPLAYTKTYAMAAAAGLSISLVPVLLGYFVRGKIRPEQHNPLNRGLTHLYRPVLNWTLRHPWHILLMAGFLVVLMAWPIQRLGSEFMPDLDEGDLMYMPTTFPGISAGKAGELLQQTDKLIMSVPEVETVFGKIGRAETATDPAPLTMIETLIRFRPKSEWREGFDMADIRRELDERVNVPGLTNAWVWPIKTRIDMLATGVKTPVGLRISGPSLGEIERIGQQVEALLSDLDGTAAVFAERVRGGRYIVVDILRDEASRYGLNIRDVQDAVTVAIGGLNVTTTVEGLERYPVNIRYPRASRDSLQRLKDLPIITPTGQQLPLSAVADFRVEEGAAMIKSENARRSGWVYVDIAGVDLGSYVSSAQELVRKKLSLPTGYSLSWTGQYEYLERAKKRLYLLVPLTLAVIILLLFLNFKSLFEVSLILGTLPLALTGGFWLLFFLNYNLSIAVGVGFIALAGVAIELGVVMMVYLNLAWAHRRSQCMEEGRRPDQSDLREAIFEGGLKRIRPVIMTVATVIAGLLPIMVGQGTGSEIMQRIAAPMVGGILTALPLALLVVPSGFYLWHSREI